MGQHVQRTVPQIDESWRLLPNGSLVKATQDYQMFRVVKGINDKLITCARLVRDEWQVYDPGWLYWPEATKRVRTWFKAFVDPTFIEQIAPYCNIVQFHNEVWANSQTKEEWSWRDAANKAAAAVWNDEFRSKLPGDIKLALSSAAVGNWISPETLRIAIRTNNVVAYHPYSLWEHKTRWEHDWESLSGLWDVMEYTYNLRPTWIFTEAGPFQSAIDGWRSGNCLGGDRVLYVEAVRQWLRDVQKTPAYHEGRILNFSLFTTGSPSPQWRSYETSQPELNELAKMEAQEWKPGTGSSPPPPPPIGEPSEADKIRWWDITINEQIAHGLQLAPTALQDAARRDRYHPVTKEMYVPGEPPMLATEDWENQSGPRRVYVYWNSKVIKYTNPHIRRMKEVVEFQWPVLNEYYKIAHPFGEPRSWGPHEGVDIVANEGDIVVASKEGDVIWASDLKRNGEKSEYGNHIVMQHAEGYFTWYAHLKEMFVEVGTHVNQGNPLGRVGETGRATGPHLHFNIQDTKNGLDGYVVSKVVDPAPLLGA